jgi:hypothetical protein
MYHWYTASGVDEIFSDMLRLSQFEAKGPVAVGTREAIGPWGAHDMAGNVKEWTVNESGDSGLRYIVGGAWNEPAYRFSEPEARDPWQRDPTFGLRLMNSTAPVPEAADRLAEVKGDPASLVPVSDEQFEILRGFYAYDWTPPDARVEAVDDGSAYWRKETVTFAGPSGERLRAFVFLPKNASPPYQTIVFFPSSYAREIPSTDALDLVTFEFIVRSGRTVIYPVYDGTYERRRPIKAGSSASRDRNVDLGQGSVQDGRLSGDSFRRRPHADRLLQSQSGRLLRSDPGRARAAHQGLGLRRRRASLRHAARNPDGQLHAAGHVPVDTRRFYREALDWYDRFLGPIR